MRLWSLHPEYLDARGLVALWREGLLAQKVLLGQTRGYRHHPQLIRFRGRPDPVAVVAAYLAVVQAEATRRGYCFDADKLAAVRDATPMPVTRGQLDYELAHLSAKLAVRDPQRLAAIASPSIVRPHPCFEVVPGPVADWEILAVSG
ncbi:DNA lyase [Acidihalobacter yilgarnensis]|uniref:DNA lyase n=1 Tax=Acidihalobacter yilgarnensis TaxID=2819280 RepID=A0A1D8IM63_9GAMM|nr:pyrimidine dimer DNA glycosylase/endonuclease V [Acidihalobacter yilgarnensis]AOU97557.1 DNA lyase [Acidihalobacter yilgarnensis]